MAFAIVYVHLLLLQISGMEQRTISGSGNFLKPERRQLVQRKRHFQRRLCWTRSLLGEGGAAEPGGDCHLLGLEWQLQGWNGTWGSEWHLGAGMAPGAGGPGARLPERPGRAGSARVLPPSLRRHRGSSAPQRSVTGAPGRLSGAGFFSTNCSSKQT